ncbi:MAG: polysaccharide lyase 6 family protein [Calditrichia bacterium]
MKTDSLFSKMTYLASSALLFFLVLGCAESGTSGTIANVSALESAIANAAPGDTLVLANGSWMDADVLFEGTGTADQPIVLMAEEPGKVVFSGASRLRLAGEHLVVSGLAFIDGHTPRGAVIEFRKDRKTLANNCRVTNCVIDNYNPEDRFKQDSWVYMHGKNNRFDHNYLANKKNSGVALVVRLNDPRSQQNFHRIDHNFFGYRPRLGSNGGETLRVGVSTYSLSSSNTIIEDNYFYRCNGETEIASIKSSDNIVRRNTFYECEGSLVMRHGDRNIVSENFFIGNDKPETGGIRVINNGHKIFNNYLYGLKGGRFRAALAVMNGVPNSLLNRYHKAKDCVISNNTFINCDNIELAVGSDFERTDVPENILIANNIMLHERNSKIYTVLDDIKGITFKTNVAYTKAGPFRSRGFIGIDPAFKKSGSGLYVPTSASVAGFGMQDFDFLKTDITGKPRTTATAGALQLDNASEFKPYATPENTGVKWYKPEAKSAAFGSGKTIAAGSGNALIEAVSNSEPGDIIELTSAEEYELTESLTIVHPLTIRAKSGLDKRPLLLHVGRSRPYSFIAIENGGSLQLSGVAFDGNSERGGVAESAIRTSRDPMIEHYSLFVDNCRFFDFQESRHNAFKAFKSTFGDTVSFTNCVFNKISGTALSMSWEKEDRGKYSAEYVFLTNNVFQNVMGEALNLYRGGNDESTFGPFLTVDHCVFDNVNNKEQGSVLRLIGVQNALIKNSIFLNSGRGGRSVKFEESRWNTVRVKNCNIYKSGRVESYYDNVLAGGMLSVKPDFVNPEAFDYRLEKGSGLIGKATDGASIGLK